jgi:hypothetical protein
MKTFQELADEAFRDLLRKYGRPTDLKAALFRKRHCPEIRAKVERRPAKQASESRAARWAILALVARGTKRRLPLLGSQRGLLGTVT